MVLMSMLGELLESRRIVHKLDVRRVLVNIVRCRCAMTWVRSRMCLMTSCAR